MKLRSVAAVAGALCALAGWTSPTPATQPPNATAPASNDAPTINPIDYVVQHACNVAGDFLNCAGTLYAQTTAEVAQYRKHDLPAPTGYQIGDCTLSPDGSMPCEFSYPPFGPFTVTNGDGGDLYVIDPGGGAQGGSAGNRRSRTGRGRHHGASTRAVAARFPMRRQVYWGYASLSPLVRRPRFTARAKRRCHYLDADVLVQRS